MKIKGDERKWFEKFEREKRSFDVCVFFFSFCANLYTFYQVTIEIKHVFYSSFERQKLEFLIWKIFLLIFIEEKTLNFFQKKKS